MRESVFRSRFNVWISSSSRHCNSGSLSILCWRSHGLNTFTEKVKGSNPKSRYSLVWWDLVNIEYAPSTALLHEAFYKKQKFQIVPRYMNWSSASVFVLSSRGLNVQTRVSDEKYIPRSQWTINFIHLNTPSLLPLANFCYSRAYVMHGTTISRGLVDLPGRKLVSRTEPNLHTLNQSRFPFWLNAFSMRRWCQMKHEVKSVKFGKKTYCASRKTRGHDLVSMIRLRIAQVTSVYQWVRLREFRCRWQTLRHCRL